eukprot:1160743-Pelagomonas_calceolata.AAC.6
MTACTLIFMQNTIFVRRGKAQGSERKYAEVSKSDEVGQCRRERKGGQGGGGGGRGKEREARAWTRVCRNYENEGGCMSIAAARSWTSFQQNAVKQPCSMRPLRRAAFFSAEISMELLNYGRDPGCFVIIRSGP